MAFPSPEDSLSLEDLINKRSFGYFANFACMPTVQRYQEAELEMALVAAGGTPNTTFGSCYHSSWWGAAGPNAPAAGFTEQPDGQEPPRTHGHDRGESSWLVQPRDAVRVGRMHYLCAPGAGSPPC